MTDDPVLEILAKRLVQPLHLNFISKRRIRRLGKALSALLPADGAVSGLDIGCGSGEVCLELTAAHPQLKLVGVDVLVRPNAVIETIGFDGQKLPFADKSFDFAMLIDVLHHTADPSILLTEAARVARSFVLLKDHLCSSRFDYWLLRFMDWVGNRAYDVELPYNYLSSNEWRKLYEKVELEPEKNVTDLQLYPLPFSCLFDANLHFLARLKTK